ncbi:MAG: ABC transporter ATP-binding protein [Crenarchaeota archaeon]|nr:ABC transporter ATP-binding protein [Thermoproteota archaeon]
MPAETAAGDYILVTENIRKTFGGLVAVDNVSIKIRRASITLLIGPNGSGKSTLLNVISGFYKPDSGRVIFEGVDVTGRPPHELYHMGLARTFQVPQPFYKLTVLENVLLAARNHPGERFTAPFTRPRWLPVEEELVDQAFEVLRLVNLAHLWDHPAGMLSGGQMKLLEIARTLMSGAKLLLMDEPIAGVNPTLAHEILRFITRLRDEKGITFFIIEHRLDIAMRYVDYVYAMARGRVIAEGKPEEVVSNPAVIESYLGG